MQQIPQLLLHHFALVQVWPVHFGHLQRRVHVERVRLANTLLQTPSNKTLPLALGQFKGEHSLDIPLILTVLVLSVLPMLILFIVFQDKLVKGMMAGAVKG